MFSRLMGVNKFTLLVTLLLGWMLFDPAFGLESDHTILVEAENFNDLGGWVLDTQVMDQMGSPFLMAHGLGRPVPDATTQVKFPAAGTYRVLVRTRDWAAPWAAPESPGRFQLRVNGEPLPVVFGTEGREWHWQEGGTVEIDEANLESTLALHDLTGFNGRCDAILFTTDRDLTPPNEGSAMARFRRQLLDFPETPEDAPQDYDLVVVGGGVAGMCAAISAARLGLQVALIQDRPLLGGNNSSEIRVHLHGGIHLPPYPALGGVVNEVGPRAVGNAGPPERYEDQRKLNLVRDEPTLELFLNTRVNGVEMEGNQIAAVVGQCVRTGRRTRFPGRWFADCTGDGNLGYLAGADYRYGRESRQETGEDLAPEQPDRQTMGTSVQWYSTVTEEPTEFPETPWAIQFTPETYQKATHGEWNWETGFLLDQIEQFEKIRDHGLRAVFGNWSFQKNHAPDKQAYANRELEWVAYIGGKRESRRLLGDVILQQQDIVQQRPFPDAAVTTTWTIDLHYPTDFQTQHFPGKEFRARAEHLRIQPYAVPYRCFYSRNVDNLFMAGRNISVTHVALGTVRVMRTLGMVGEVVGMAAAVCKRHDVNPRQVYTEHLEDLKELMTAGVGRLPLPASARPPETPEWVEDAGPNLARIASELTVSGCYDPERYPASNLNDGRISYHNNSLRWVSDTRLPHSVEIAWDTAQTLGGVRIVTGYGTARGPQDPVRDFVFQYHDGEEYRDIVETRTADNTAIDWNARFPAVTTARLRLVVSASPNDRTRLWQIEAYGPVPDDDASED